ncbi:TRAP transporter substrate-binding protein [Thioclava sp. GXIMD2076]|uniref:TRAP transporter substrate-binding protein n=1 Tax=unclassified Thioclava TaxID=2621713 RepID=UPI0030CD3295
MKGSLTLASALALATFTSGAYAADVTLKFGGINPPDAPVTKASKWFAEEVDKRTEGRVHVDFYEGSQLGSGPQQIEAMAVGAQDGYISSGSNASNLVKEYGVIDTPFLFKSKEHFLKFMDSDIAKGLNEKLQAEYNVRILATNWFREPRVFLTKDACVTGPEDIAGKRSRAPNLPMFVEGWKAIGTVPVTVSYGETYMALKQGLADMTESAGEQVYSSKFYEVLPYVTDAQMMYPQNSVYIAESSYEQLSDEDKTIVTKAAEDAGDYFVKLVQEADAPNRQKMKDAGVTFCELSPEARAAFQEKVSVAVPEFEANGLIPKGWWDKIQAMQ